MGTKLKSLPFGSTSEPLTTQSSLAARLPQELMEMILSHLVYDKRTLLACSMACCSWYIVTVSHLHHSLTTNNVEHQSPRKYVWPRPLEKSHKLGLLPLIKQFRVRIGSGYKFGPEQLNGRTLHYFSALVNLQELGIDFLQVSRFMPNLQQYFGHFSPTLRFLALKEPDGSPRQIIYFIGLFPNLQDLKLQYNFPRRGLEVAVDTALIPLSTPPLQGWLTLISFTTRDLMKEMIALFGGLRFHHMDLFKVNCMQLLFEACAETLETIRLYPTDAYREEFLERWKI